MWRFIDDFLNRTTMYRLALYYLAVLWFIGFIFSIFGLLPYSPLAMAVSLLFILAICWLVNNIFALAFESPINIESLYITGFILALIITPVGAAGGFHYLFFLFFVSLWAIASKFLAAIKKHIFNPAALAVALSAGLLGQSASWWIGNPYLTVPVFLGGYLIVRKIRRWDMVLSFFVTAILSITIPEIMKRTALTTIFSEAIFHSPLFFFAFIMLTEPLTTPPRSWSRIAYGALVGILFSPAFHIGSTYFTPELALLSGNIFSYLVSSKKKLILKLEEIIPIGDDLYDLVFSHSGRFNFRPGQYLEWTMGHDRPDSNGVRRYFTIASAPTEKEIRIGVKFNSGKSSYKRALLSMRRGDTIVAQQLAGDFTLPKNIDDKLVFIAGGIGITPFRSMIKYVLDKNEERDIILFYSCRLPEEITYKKIFDAAGDKLGIRTVYTLTGKEAPSVPWCYRGRINAAMIEKEVPDYTDRTYYISGPHNMVEAYKKILKDLGIKPRQIKTDYFPGFV